LQYFKQTNKHLKENIDGLSNGRYFYSNNHRDTINTPLLAMEEQMKIAIIDFSMLKHAATHAVKKHQDLNSMDGHLVCITQRCSEILFALQTLHKFDRVVFALDTKPYWRQEEMDAFYRTNTHFLEYQDEIYWSGYGAIYQADENGKLKKLKKKEGAEILANGRIRGDFATIAEEFPLPKYKGHRKPMDLDWLDCHPVKYFRLMESLPFAYRGLLKGAVVSVEGAEADDIAGILSHRANEKGNEVVLITGDSDWAQLAAYYPNVTFLNPYREQTYTHADREAIVQKTLVKIIGGDSGDGIKGCPTHKSYGPLGETKAAGIVEAKSWGLDIPKAYLDHNKRMVRLHPDSLPFDIIDAIHQAVADASKMPLNDTTWEELGLTRSRQDELMIDSKAKELWELVMEK